MRRTGFGTGGQSRRVGALWVVAVALAAVTLAPRAAAYCRTTTCDPRDPHQRCGIDANSCVTGGIPLFWPTACVSFGVQRDGSPLRSISADTAQSVIETSFMSWLGARCGAGAPSITLGVTEQIECDHPEYSPTAANANVWMFRDDGWPYPDAVDGTLALTMVTYATETGEILDADVELDSFDRLISANGTGVGFDLKSIATHEAGHFLGLSHSSVFASTMYSNYSSADSTLDADDIAAICAAYPPGRVAKVDQCLPRHGFSSRCAPPETDSCAAARIGADSRSAAPSFLMAAAALWVLIGRSKRRAAA